MWRPLRYIIVNKKIPVKSYFVGVKFFRFARIFLSYDKETCKKKYPSSPERIVVFI